MRKYKQLTATQRYSIQVCLQKGMTQAEIASIVGVSQSTISREIRRNRTEKRKVYSATSAHTYAMERRMWTRNERSKSNFLKAKVKKYLEEEQWSPEQISGYLLKEEGKTVSTQTIYNWIEKDKVNGGTLYLNCRHHKKKRKGGYKTASARHIPNRNPIQDRPIEADGTRFGDFEMDTIIGKNQKSVILTLVDKATGFIIIERLKDGKKPDEVADVVANALLPFKGHIHTITTDNGFEFRSHQEITRRINAKVYFTDPYSSWQKGAIENANKLIRQYIAKKADFNLITDNEIKEIQEKLNRRPRKRLNYETPISRLNKILR